MSVQFYADHVLTQAPTLMARITDGGESVLAFPLESF